MLTVEEFEKEVQCSLSGFLLKQGFLEAPASDCFNGKAICKNYVGHDLTLQISSEKLEGDIELSLFPRNWKGSPLGLELLALLRSLGRPVRGYLPSRSAGAAATLAGYARLLGEQARDVLSGQVPLRTE